MFGQLLPIFAATADVGNGGEERKHGISLFPGEEPSPASDEELREWLKLNAPLLRQSYGAAIRNETPSHLIKYQNGPDISAFTRITVGSEEAKNMTTAQVQLHNHRVAEAEAAKAERERNSQRRYAGRRERSRRARVTMMI